MKAIFITGTDTRVGKTVITGLLGRFLLAKGYRVITEKWIQSGTNGFPEDIRLHLRLMKKGKNYIGNYLPHIASYVFKFASSPHLAARLEGRRINVNKIKKSFKFLSDKFDFVLVEGAGGVLVPFNKKRLIIDIAGQMKLPALIVAGNRLGAINHTLLTIEALRKRKMDIVGVIFNNQPGKTEGIILRDNPRIIKELTGETILGILPRMKNKDLLYKKFYPVGEKIYRYIKCVIG